jgi:arylsulfatase A
MVEQPSEYSASVLYSCSEENIGSTICLRINDEVVTARIEKAHDPEYIHSPDRVKRIEVFEKEWAELSLGTLTIPAGRQSLIIKAQKTTGEVVCELKGLVLKK